VTSTLTREKTKDTQTKKLRYKNVKQQVYKRDIQEQEKKMQKTPLSPFALHQRLLPACKTTTKEKTTIKNDAFRIQTTKEQDKRETRFRTVRSSFLQLSLPP
jgi:hypothetical protein